MMGASNDLARRKELVGGGGGMAPPFAPPMGMATNGTVTNGMPQPGMATGGFNGNESPVQMRGGDPNSFLGHVLNADPNAGRPGGKAVADGSPQVQLGTAVGAPIGAAGVGSATQGSTVSRPGPATENYAATQAYRDQRANRRPRRLGMF
jgi:hypothetical protein